MDVGAVEDVYRVDPVVEGGGTVFGEARVVVVVVVVVELVLTAEGACVGGWGGETVGTDGDDIIPELSPLKNSSRFVCIEVVSPFGFSPSSILCLRASLSRLASL